MVHDIDNSNNSFDGTTKRRTDYYGQSDYDDYDAGYSGGRRKNRGLFGDLFYF
jgi:hypothetical protein